MKDIDHIIQACADTTRSKGFNTAQHATQVALIATEVAEALECISDTEDDATMGFITTLGFICDRYERHRKAPRNTDTQHIDHSTVRQQMHLDEELADIVIRVFSYVGGNDRKEQFITALLDKIEENKGRPPLHGKAF